MSKQINAYEPVFGGIVFILSAALLCFVLFSSTSPGTSRTGVAFLSILCARVMVWGVAQIMGYRRDKRDNIKRQPPVLGTPLGCVLVGLMLALATVILYEFAPTHRGYTIASGGVAGLLLLIGAGVGIRQGVWR
jgi:hypothetical protein